MKIFKYFFEFISIISLFCIFKIIGLKNASNLGSIIGRGLRFALVGYLAKIFENQFDKMLKSKEIFYISIGLILVLIIYLIIKWI